MSTYAELYWLTRLDLIPVFSLVVLIISASSFIVVLLLYIIDEDIKRYNEENKNRIIKLIRTLFILSSVSGLLMVFIPSKNDVIFIVAGGKTIDFIKKDKNINRIPSQTTAVISSFLQKQIDAMEKDSVNPK